MNKRGEDKQLMDLLKSVAMRAYCDAKGYDYPPGMEVFLPREALYHLKLIISYSKEQAEKDILYRVREAKRSIPVHGGTDSLYPSRRVEAVDVSSIDMLIQEIESRHE